MAIAVPSATETTTKWTQNTSNAGQFYKTGVERSGQLWQTGVDNGQQSWSSGVSAAVANNSYSRGVQNKANKYVTNAVNLGVTRFSTGVQQGASAYSTQIGKVLQVIGAITLPPRGAVGTNMIRAQVVADALHQAKLNGQFV